MDYEGIRTRSDKTITKNGKLVTLELSTAASYNPVTGVETGAATTAYTAYAVESAYTQNQRDGTLVLANDRRFIISGLQASGAELPAITTAYKLKIESKTFEIVNVIPTKPGAVPVIYEVQCRG